VSAPVAEPVEAPTEPGDELVHVVCDYCLIKWRAGAQAQLFSLCGMDMTEDNEIPLMDYGPFDCSMCVEVATGRPCVCPYCGAQLARLW
jgi:hypothetical protein